MKKFQEVRKQLEMKKKFDTVKAHVKANKKVYITGVSCFAAGVVATALRSSNDGIDVRQIVKQINILSPRPTQNVIQMALPERSTPSKPIMDKENLLPYASINEAVRQTGRTRSSILNDPNFELLAEASQ